MLKERPLLAARVGDGVRGGVGDGIRISSRWSSRVKCAVVPFRDGVRQESIAALVAAALLILGALLCSLSSYTCSTWPGPARQRQVSDHRGFQFHPTAVRDKPFLKSL